MSSPDGREVLFALAGLIWGTVTLYRGILAWREGRSLTSRVHAGGMMSIERVRVPSSIIGGAAVIGGCTWYLLWRLL